MFIIRAYIKQHTAYIRIINMLAVSMIIYYINYIDNQEKKDNTIIFNGLINGFEILNFQGLEGEEQLQNSTHKGLLKITYIKDKKNYTYLQGITEYVSINDIMIAIRNYNIGDFIPVYTDLEGNYPTIVSFNGINNFSKKKLIATIFYGFLFTCSLLVTPLFILKVNNEVKISVCQEIISNICIHFSLWFSFYRTYPPCLMIILPILFLINTTYTHLDDSCYIYLLISYGISMSMFVTFYENEFSPFFVLVFFTIMHFLYINGYIMYTYEEKWNRYILHMSFYHPPLDNRRVAPFTPQNVVNKIKCMICSKENILNKDFPPSYKKNEEECIVCTDKKPLIYFQECGHTVACKECIDKLKEPYSP